MNVSPIVAGKVSIIIPAYNCAHTVDATIESCLAQTYGNIEIIVVNDGSTDNTAAVLQTFGRKIVVINKKNGGVAASRNAGVRATDGEFVMWMDHDDLMAPERVRLQVEVLLSDQSIGLVSSDFSAFITADSDFESSHIASYYSAVARLGGLEKIYSQSRVFAAAVRTGDPPILVREGWIYDSLLSGNFVHPPTVVVRRCLLDQVGECDETLRYNSEYDLIVRISRVARAAYIETPLLRYRRSETQLSHGGAGGKIALETARVLEKIRLEDPALYNRHPALFRHRLATQFINAADMIGPSDRVHAFRLLLRGVRHKLLVGAALRAFVRIIAPRAVVKAIKRVWRGLATAIT